MPIARLSGMTTQQPCGRMLPRSEFLARPWRIHEVTSDFSVLDVWQLPTPGGPGELRVLADIIAAGRGEAHTPAVVRLLWSARWTLGKLLRWDRPEHGIGIRVPSLNARLPEDLKDAPIGPDFSELPFTSIFQLRDEYAAELANATCHGVLHLGWVQTQFGCWTAQLTVLVKPNGLLGRAYLMGIRPFRHTLVYPALMRTIERDWRAARSGGAISA